MPRSTDGEKKSSYACRHPWLVDFCVKVLLGEMCFQGTVCEGANESAEDSSGDSADDTESPPLHPSPFLEDVSSDSGK